MPHNSYKIVDVFFCQRKISTTKSEYLGEKETPPFFFIEAESSLLYEKKCIFNILGQGLKMGEC